MSLSRGSVPSPLSLFALVEEDIRSKKLDKSKLVAETRQKISNGLTNRVFDSLPRAADDMILATLGHKYLTIVQNARFSGPENLEPNISTKLQMETWTRDLIKLGMAELFDERGDIKHSIVDLFGWGGLRTCIDRKKLVSAYVGAIMAQVMFLHQDYINKELSDSNGRVCSFINGRYPNWIEEIMIEKGFQSGIPITPGKLAAVAGAGLFFGLFGVVATVSYFAATANASSVNEGSGYSGPKL